MYTRGQQRYVTRGPIFVEKFAREPHYLKKTFEGSIYFKMF